MTIEELYEEIDGDYAAAITRLQNEALVGRFIVKFLDDRSCSDTIESWRSGDDRAAFEAAHTAKGVCANLAITGLAKLASDITEALRPGNDDVRANTDVDDLVNRFDVAYRNVSKAIAAFAENA